MTGLQNDCQELNDYGIDPSAFADWVHRKQLRQTLDAAFPRTSVAERLQLINGAARIVERNNTFTLVFFDTITPVVPTQSVYTPSLQLN